MTFVTIGLYDLQRSADAVMLHEFNGTYYKMPVLFFFFFLRQLKNVIILRRPRPLCFARFPFQSFHHIENVERWHFI